MTPIAKPIASMVSSICVLSVVGCTQTVPGSQTTENNTSEPTVIELTQTGCQFLETEGQDYQYQTSKAEDCKKINTDTLAERKPQFEPLNLKAGEYIFKVTNQDVPYELGFYLRGAGAGRLSLPKVSGGGLTEGITQEYTITLTPGNYVFSCPLNPTPDYPIVVN